MFCIVHQKMYTVMAPQFWAKALEFRTVSETSDSPTWDNAG